MTPEDINENLFPFANTLGMRVTSLDKDCVAAEMLVRPEICTSGDLLHGGAIMAFADSLGAIATFVNLPEDATGTTTIESKTNFFRGTKAGEMVFASSTPLHRGRTTQVWQTRISNAEGKSVAMVTQTQMVLR